MNDLPPADAVRARMKQLRCEIDGDVEDMATRARSMVDWKHYVKTYPWVCLGTAAAVGFLVVPKRRTAIHADLAARTAPARTGPMIADPAYAATRGWVDSLLVNVAGIAVRTAVELLGRGAVRLLGAAADGPPRPPPAGDGVSQRECRRG